MRLRVTSLEYKFHLTKFDGETKKRYKDHRLPSLKKLHAL